MTYKELLELTKKSPNPFSINGRKNRFFDYEAKTDDLLEEVEQNAETYVVEKTTEREKPAENVKPTVNEKNASNEKKFDLYTKVIKQEI